MGYEHYLRIGVTFTKRIGCKYTLGGPIALPRTILLCEYYANGNPELYGA